MFKRFAAAVLMIAFVAFAPAGCRHKKPPVVKAASDDGLSSVINVADPMNSVQLVRGFFNVEANTWRWTKGKFLVVLRPPEGSAKNGAKLDLHFTLVDAVFSKTGPLTVSATVNGTAIPGETYSQAGEYTYTQDVPASALSSDVATVEFSTDKVLGPNPQDQRELALIVTGMGLASK